MHPKAHQNKRTARRPDDFVSYCEWRLSIQDLKDIRERDQAEYMRERHLSWREYMSLTSVSLCYSILGEAAF